MISANTSTDSKTIFLVDDEFSIANLYGRSLEEAGFRTSSVVGAEAASEALPNRAADLIILDLMVPKSGGLELLKAIRSDERHRTTPILVLSNTFLPDLAQKALSVGGNRALFKSECSSAELLSVSRELVGIEKSGAEGVLGTDVPEQLSKTVLEQARAEAQAIRENCFKYVGASGSEEGNEYLQQIYQRVHFLSAAAGFVSCRNIARLSEAIEAMLFDHVFGSNRGMSPSSIQTLVQAVDLLERLFTTGNAMAGKAAGRARILLVDDDVVCNLANEMALKRVQYDPVSAEDGGEALNLLRDNRFDLVLLDIDMPGMNGLEVCQRLRSLPHHQHTPVIFVTLHQDFQNRALSVLSGGNDLIAKPISPVELLVKATVFLLDPCRSQVPQDEPDTGPAVAEPALATTSTPMTPTEGLCAAGKPEASSWLWDSNSAPSQAEAGGHKLNTLQEAVNEKLQHLQQALAEATKRREAAQNRAAENVKRRKELEAAIEENQRSQQMFYQLLEESQKKAAAEGGAGGGRLKFDGRRRVLLEMGDFVSNKLTDLRKALAEETTRRQALEDDVARNAKNRQDLELALDEIQRIQAAFQQEVENVEDPQELVELEVSLAQIQQAQLNLEGELETAQRELQALLEGEAARQAGFETRTNDLPANQAEKEEVERVVAERSRLESRIQELQAAHTGLHLEVQQKKEALASETARRQAVKQRAAEHAKVRKQVEAALAENQQTEQALQREWEASDGAKRWAELETGPAESKSKPQTRAEQQLKQAAGDMVSEAERAAGAKCEAATLAQDRSALVAELSQLETQLEQAQKREQSARAEQAEIQARLTELQTGRTSLEEELAAETRCRENAEQRARDLAQRQSELDAELAESKRWLAIVRQELEAAQSQLQAAQTSSRAEQARLGQQVQELQEALSKTEREVRRLTEALAEEIKRRGEAEREASEIRRRWTELQTKLAESQTLQATLREELEQARAQVRAEALARQELEQAKTQLRQFLELKENQQNHAQLRQQLEEAQVQLQALTRKYEADQAGLDARTKQLQGARVTVDQQVRHLAESLAKEIERRKGAEQEADESGKRRRELETELTENHHTQEQLRDQLKEVERQVESLKENYYTEKAELEARSQELQTTQAEVERKIRRLAEALAFETKRREAVERLAVEAFRRRRELEAQLAKIQEAEQALREQLRSSEHDAKRRRELEAELAQNQQEQARLRQRLEEAHHQLRAQKEHSLAEQSRIEANAEALRSAQTDLEQKVKRANEALTEETRLREAAEQQLQRVTEMLAEETKCREVAEQQASEQGQRSGQLEAEQAELRQQLEEAQRQFDTQQEASLDKLAKLEARTHELEAAEAAAEQKVAALTSSLAEETKHRKEAEQEASGLSQRRSELEAELAQVCQQLEASRKQLEAETQLRQELEQTQQQLNQLFQFTEDTVTQEQSEGTQHQLEFQKERFEADQPRLEEPPQPERPSGVLNLVSRLIANTLGRLVIWRRNEAKPQRTEKSQPCSQQQTEAAKRQPSLATLPPELQPKQLLAQLPSSTTEPTSAQGPGQQVPIPLVEFLQRFKRLTESLAQETKHREAAERQAGQLEAELTRSREAQAELQGALQQTRRAGLESLKATLDQFQSIQSTLAERVRMLTPEPDCAGKLITDEEDGVEGKAARRL